MMGWLRTLVLIVAALPASAWAESGTIAWPTFYRAGPDKHFAVLEELQRGRTLDVLSCEGDWCRVQNGRSIGYVEAGALATPAPPKRPADPAPCFESRSSGYGKGEVFRYCPQKGS